MKDIFRSGDKKELQYIITDEDVASFHGTVVHPVCATFVLAREIEWATRQFVLDMRDDDEEGIGTFLSIDHKSPAYVGEELTIESTVDELNEHKLICSYIARVGSRVVATGKTGQKILKRKKMAEIMKRPSA